MGAWSSSAALAAARASRLVGMLCISVLLCRVDCHARSVSAFRRWALSHLANSYKDGLQAKSGGAPRICLCRKRNFASRLAVGRPGLVALARRSRHRDTQPSGDDVLRALVR